MTATEKPFAPACERNQAVILSALKQHLRADDRNILELGSGTGQHAVYMGQHLPNICWQTSDVRSQHAGIQLWLNEAQLDNVQSPLLYEVGQDAFPEIPVDVVFSANFLHILAKALIETLVVDLGKGVAVGTRVMFYGPFKYQGAYTAESNASFDQWLKDTDPQSGVRDFEWVNQLLQVQAFNLLHDLAMPANNQLLIFEKL